MSDCKEIILHGLPISKGIGIGFPLFFSDSEDDIPEIPISRKEVEHEIERYRKALSLSRQDVEQLQRLSMKDGPVEIVAILGTHLEMMQDPLMTTVMEQQIRDKQRNTESIFHSVVQEYKSRFRSLQDGYFQERVRDIDDVSRRILSHLNPRTRLRISDIPNNSIILAQELVPSDTVEATSSSVSAFVTAAGGVTSHAAIIARAKGIPYVANVDLRAFKNIKMKSLIVDGTQGIIIINPTTKTLKKYQKLKKGLIENYKLLKTASHLKGETIDGYEVRIYANLENPKDVENVASQDAVGIGLFRSEYLYLSKKKFPSEQQQFTIYRRMAEKLSGRPLVIRVFDIGGDKKIEESSDSPDGKYFKEIGEELNPALGCRAIRFLLRFPEILKFQLRAILRASAYGEVRILLPMISDVSELTRVREYVRALAEELKRKGVPVADRIPIGCMIEVPSSAIMCDMLAERADFLSIGTNDLVQYVMAADRSNPNTNELYYPTHPSLLRLIRMIVSSSNRFGKPLLLCGECAADPTMIPILLGLGIREFSVAPGHIPLVKHTIRKWRVLDACKLAEEALTYLSAPELKQFLDQSLITL